MSGSSFSGLLTRVEIGHITISSERKGTKRPRGKLDIRQPPIVRVRRNDHRHAMVYAAAPGGKGYNDSPHEVQSGEEWTLVAS